MKKFCVRTLFSCVVLAMTLRASDIEPKKVARYRGFMLFSSAMLLCRGSSFFQHTPQFLCKGEEPHKSRCLRYWDMHSVYALKLRKVDGISSQDSQAKVQSRKRGIGGRSCHPRNNSFRHSMRSQSSGQMARLLMRLCRLEQEGLVVSDDFKEEFKRIFLTSAKWRRNPIPSRSTPRDSSYEEQKKFMLQQWEERSIDILTLIVEDLEQKKKAQLHPPR